MIIRTSIIFYRSRPLFRYKVYQEKIITLKVAGEYHPCVKFIRDGLTSMEIMFSMFCGNGTFTKFNLRQSHPRRKIHQNFILIRLNTRRKRIA